MLVTEDKWPKNFNKMFKNIERRYKIQLKMKLILPIIATCSIFNGIQGMLLMTTNNKLPLNPPPPPTFPFSRRALIEKAKSIDPGLAKNTDSGIVSLGPGSYSTIGWSNRLGTVLTPASTPGVYTADRPFKWNDIDVGCRMTVIQLETSSENGLPDLFVHSPVFLDPPLISALEKLGTVKHVVSPNYEHVKFAKQWADYYKDAKIWGCPGIMEKEPLVNWTGEIPIGCRPPGYDFPSSTSKSIDGMWDWEEVQPLHVDCERLPILGTPFFSEVVFYHKPSKTLLVTDTYWNYPRLDGKTNADYAKLVEYTTEGEDIDFGVWELAPDVGRIPIGSRYVKMVKRRITSKVQNMHVYAHDLSFLLVFLCFFLTFSLLDYGNLAWIKYIVQFIFNS